MLDGWGGNMSIEYVFNAHLLKQNDLRLTDAFISTIKSQVSHWKFDIHYSNGEYSTPQQMYLLRICT